MHDLSRTAPLYRVDVAASRAIEAVMRRVHDPALHALYQEYRPMIDQCLNDYLGPVPMERFIKSNPLASAIAAVVRNHAG